MTVGTAGASGTGAGTAGADGGDGALVPNAFVAVTVHVYVAPLVKPVTVTGDAVPIFVPGVPEPTQLAV